METLRYWRRLRFFTQEELAAKLGVTVKTLGQWERGEAEPRPQHLKALCETLGVAPEELLGRPGEAKKEIAA